MKPQRMHGYLPWKAAFVQPINKGGGLCESNERIQFPATSKEKSLLLLWGFDMFLRLSPLSYKCELP